MSTIENIIIEAGLDHHKQVVLNTLNYLRNIKVCITEDELSIVTSSGSSFVIKPSHKAEEVYQYFFSRETMNNIVDMYKAVYPHPHIVEMTRFNLQSQVISWRRLEFPDKEQVVNEIREIGCSISDALDHIHEKGYIHGDPRLDNVGLFGYPPKYVLFDFNLSKKSNNPEDHQRDRYVLAKSIVYHVG